MMTWPNFLGCLAAILLSSCSTITPEEAFEHAERAVRERTGQRIHWLQGTEADKAVTEEITLMLRDELTEPEAMQIALLNNRSLQATYEELSIAQADLVQAGLLSNPVFELEAKFPEGGGRSVLELAVVQSFLDVFFVPLRRRVASASLEGAQLRVTAEAVRLATDVRKAFFTVQAATQLQELQSTVFNAAGGSFLVMKRLREAGNVTQLELLLNQLLFEQVRLDLSQADLQLTRAREELNALLGLFGNQTSWKVAARLPETVDGENEASVESVAIEKSLDLAILSKELSLLAAQAGLAGPESLLSELEIGAIAERDGDGGWEGGPTLSIPIPLFDFGQAERASARARLRAAQQRYWAKAVEVRSVSRSTNTALNISRQAALHYKRVMLPLREALLKQMQLQYNAMQLGPVALLQARRDQVLTAAAYVQALKDYWIARSERDQLLSGVLPEKGPTGPVSDVAGNVPSTEGGH